VVGSNSVECFFGFGKSFVEELGMWNVFDCGCDFFFLASCDLDNGAMR
jgi:hypothetical protein